MRTIYLIKHVFPTWQNLKFCKIAKHFLLFYLFFNSVLLPAEQNKVCTSQMKFFKKNLKYANSRTAVIMQYQTNIEVKTYQVTKHKTNIFILKFIPVCLKGNFSLENFHFPKQYYFLFSEFLKQKHVENKNWIRFKTSLKVQYKFFYVLLMFIHRRLKYLQNQ